MVTMGEMVKLTGLWKQKDKQGNVYLSGSLSPVSKIVVMANTFKEGDKNPDYFLYVSQQDKKEGKPTVKGNDL
jgi:hypothetical protein